MLYSVKIKVNKDFNYFAVFIYIIPVVYASFLQNKSGRCNNRHQSGKLPLVYLLPLPWCNKAIIDWHWFSFFKILDIQGCQITFFILELTCYWYYTFPINHLHTLTCLINMPHTCTNYKLEKWDKHAKSRTVKHGVSQFQMMLAWRVSPYKVSNVLQRWS